MLLGGDKGGVEGPAQGLRIGATSTELEPTGGPGPHLGDLQLGPSLSTSGIPADRPLAGPGAV